MEIKRTQAVLDAFKKFVIKQARTRLTKGKKNVSKDLYNSLKGDVKASENSFRVEFIMEDYGVYIDKGVSGKDKKYDTPYSFRDKKPPAEPLAKWAKARNIRLRDEAGKFKKGNYTTIGYILANSIFKKGIKPSLFFTIPFQQGFKKLPEELAKSYALDVEDFLAYTLKEDRLR